MVDKEFYVVGVYETMHHDIFPTHLSPIIVEKSKFGFRRWHYRILSPYRIVPAKPIGEFRETLTELFPYPSYSFIRPKKITTKTQIVGFSSDYVFIGSNKLLIALNVILIAIRNYKSLSYIKRAKLTLFNIFT